MQYRDGYRPSTAGLSYAEKRKLATMRKYFRENPMTKQHYGHFEFWKCNSEGTPIGNPVKCGTEIGVILQCDQRIDEQQVKRLCAIARETADYPVDLSAWTGPDKDRRMVWCARIYWRAMK